MIGELASAIAPITGNAFLAASLKNSLRDWSSSFCFFSFMILKINRFPYSLDGFSGYSSDTIHGAKIRLFNVIGHARNRRHAHIRRGYGSGIQLKKVNSKRLADGQQLLRVDGGFEEYLLYGARMDIDSLGKPLVSVPLPPKLFPNHLSNVDLHKRNRELFVGLEVLDYLPSKQESSRFTVSDLLFC